MSQHTLQAGEPHVEEHGAVEMETFRLMDLWKTPGNTKQISIEQLALDVLTTEELQHLLPDIASASTQLQEENALLGSYLDRHGADRVAAPLSGSSGSALPSAESGPSSTATVADTAVTELLNWEQKAIVAAQELEEWTAFVEKHREEADRTVDDLRAEVETLHYIDQVIKKEMYSFRRDIVQRGVDDRTNRYAAEKVAKWYEDATKAKDAETEKFRLKTATTRQASTKLHTQLKQKEEMGEVLHAIDFEQLKIENAQYLQKIEERNAALLKLKVTAGKTIQKWNAHKRHLNLLIATRDKLDATIKSRRDAAIKMGNEQAAVKAESEQAKEVKKDLHQQVTTYKVPELFDYVTQTAAYTEASDKVHSWHRKVEIAELEHKRLKGNLNSLKQKYNAQQEQQRQLYVS